ncbi:MAG: hypothetical protein GWN01_05555 [Nitrosopumilaceae archaeon]|nr:hypothetical protein [Nitrosopumilaceae archaeon]NIU86814.1 hypothetical protein [Nitrosopumilaceae archaeon]NIX61011.1 hypothetical protein [Nitrosopumilaceae archaeon]
MTIIWKTKKINIQAYYKIIRRTFIFNADRGFPGTGYAAWKQFKREWKVYIIPVDQAEKYKEFYGHLNVETSDGIAWGVTGQRVIYMFVVDSRNPFTTRSNAMPIAHELLHAVYQQEVGTFHVTRKYDAPEGRKGTRGAAATVIVHDNWYGSKETMRFWIAWGIPPWLPITIPYIPIEKAKQLYAI